VSPGGHGRRRPRRPVDGVYSDDRTFFITSMVLAVLSALALVVAAVLLSVR
jgi:hypothetical protein